MDKELDKRRSWPWKKKNGMYGPEGGTSPSPVKLFDEQEVARILQDQARIGDEQMLEALRDAEVQHCEKERLLNEKFAAVNEKLTSALAEVTIKDNLVKQHIKVAEEAVAGWEKAENEAAAFKSQLDLVIQQRLATEDRVKHLDGALKEVMKQLRSGREEQEQRIHETIVKKTREYDKLRVEMEAKLAEASHLLAQTRTEFIESRAENQALTHALQDRARMIADLNDGKARAETNIKVLQVRLEGMEKENMDLKYEIHVVAKELEIRSSELDYERRASEVATRQHADGVKKITKLEDECNRLRVLVRKKLPSPAAMVRMKQEIDALGKEPGELKPRRRPLGRSQSGVDTMPPQEMTTQENVEDAKGTGTGTSSSWEADVLAERIVNMDEETRMLKEALSKRNDELQAARIMCARTASRLSSVEDELEALKSAASPPRTALSDDASHDAWAPASAAILEPTKKVASRRDSSNFELMDDFVEMERLANSQSRSQSVAGSEHALETASVNGPDTSHYQGQIAGLEEALAVKDRDLEAANHMCNELSAKLTAAEDQLCSLQSRNAANERSVINLQDQLDRLLESHEEAAAAAAASSANEHTLPSDAESKASTAHAELAVAVRKAFHMTEALARATGSEFAPSTSGQSDASPPGGSIAMSVHWQELQLESSMAGLALAANKLLQGESDTASFVFELAATLDCIMALCIIAIEDLRRERDGAMGEGRALSENLESAKVQVSQLEEELRTIRAERAALETHMRVEMGRFPGLEAEIVQLRTEKAQVEHNLSAMEHNLSEANERVEALREQLNDAEALVAELRAQQAAHDKEKKEEELIEEELLELSSPNPGLAMSIRAADAEMNQLHDKVAALEVELHGERRRHHEVVAKLEDLQQQIHRGVGRSEHSSGSLHSKETEWLQLSMADDDATKIARKEREIAAAALAECQRTILALGKQLKVLGFREPTEHALATADPRDSIQQMTQSMEFLRWQAESVEQPPPPPPPPPPAPPVAGTDLAWAGSGGVRPARPALPGLYYRQNNSSSGTKTASNGGLSENMDGAVPVTVAVLSDFSGQAEIPSPSPGSPAAPMLRSVRTIRAAMPLAKAVNNHNDASANVDESPDLRRASTSFPRFYSRSHSSEGSMLSGHSNGFL